MRSLLIWLLMLAGCEREPRSLSAGVAAVRARAQAFSRAAATTGLSGKPPRAPIPSRGFDMPETPLPEEVAIDGERDRARLQALLSVLDRQAGSAAAALRVRTEVFARLKQRAPAIGQAIGFSVLDSRGRVQDPARVLQALKEVIDRRFDISAREMALREILDNDGGRVVYRADLGDVDQLANQMMGEK